MKKFFIIATSLALMFHTVCYGENEIELNISNFESEGEFQGYSITQEGTYSGKIEPKITIKEDSNGEGFVTENIDKISRNKVLFCVGMSYPFEEEVQDCFIDDESIVNCYNNMLNGLSSGETRVKVVLETEVQILDVTVIDPIVNTDTLTASSEDFQVQVFGDLKGADVKYAIISDDENATIDSEGNAHVPYGSGGIITVDVAGKVFAKEINGVDYKSKIWNDMQYGIQQCLGTPYMLGGFSPGAALDCSGYVSYIMNTVGLMSGRTTAQGLYNMCKKTDEPVPGDIVFFAGTYACPDYITHVGLYAGGNTMYHSGNPNQLVEISGYYAQHFVGFGTLIY